MPALAQFDYLFAIGTIFAFLDAWNIGKFLLLVVFSGTVDHFEMMSNLSTRFAKELEKSTWSTD